MLIRDALAEYYELTQELKKRQGINALKSGKFTLPVFEPLLRPGKTYRAAYGGRASAKSYFFADLHLMRALNGPYRALCLREVQKSIKESLKFLLEQRIQFWGIGERFDILDTTIRHEGGEFVFHGLQNHTAESIKSFEGFDVADIEEAQTVKQRSLDLLVPTIIRKPGAEVWARWNPRQDTDPIDKMFRGKTSPPNSVVVKCSFRDNPHLSQEVQIQIAADYENDPEKAEHVWGGGYEVYSEGAYYAKLLHKADKEGRIGDYPYNPKLPLITAWDIGVDDYTAIWLFQIISAQKIHAVGYYETSGIGAEEILYEFLPDVLAKPDLREAGMRELGLKDRRTFQKHHLPHDVAVREWAGGAKTRRQTLTELGMRNIIPGKAQGPAERVNATRQVLPLVHFDTACHEGLRRLRQYSRKQRADGVYLGPDHDENSHGADAFGEFAINSPVKVRAADKPKPNRDRYSGKQDTESWMTV